MSAPRGAGPWLAFALCCAIWGSTFLFIRIGNDTLAPVWASGLRLAIASVLLMLIALAVRAPWPRTAQLEAALWFGFVDFGISLPLLYWGEKSVPSGLASVLYATIPLSTALLARAFGLERLRPIKIVASVIAIGGVTLLFSSSLGGTFSPGALLAVWVAAATAALAGVLLKRAPGGHPLATNAIAQGVGAVVCLAASALLHEHWTVPHGSGWVSIVYLVFIGSITAFVTFAWLLQRWPVTRTSFIAVVIPVIALALGLLVRSEKLTATSIAGSVIILGAVTMGLLADRGASASQPTAEP